MQDSVGSSISVSTSNAALAAAAAQDADEDVVSYSLSAYNWEFSEHPDLACTWSADPPFLEHFAKASAPAPRPCCTCEPYKLWIFHRTWSNPALPMDPVLILQFLCMVMLDDSRAAISNGKACRGLCPNMNGVENASRRL